MKPKELLAAASHDPECKAKRPCEACGAREEARLTIRRLGFTPATLAVAIKLADALAKYAGHEDDCLCEDCQALAEYDSLGE